MSEDQISVLKKLFMSMKIIHIVLCSGVFIFLLADLYLVYIRQISAETDPDKVKLYQVISVSLFIIFTFLGYLLYKNKISFSKKLTNINHKIQAYSFSLMIKMAFLEGSALFSLVIYMTTANNIPLIMSILSLFIMIINFPSLRKIAEELELSEEEKILIGADNL